MVMFLALLALGFVLVGLLVVGLALTLLAHRLPTSVLALLLGAKAGLARQYPAIWDDAACYCGRLLLTTGLYAVLAAAGLALIPGVGERAYVVTWVVAVVAGILATGALTSRRIQAHLWQQLVSAHLVASPSSAPQHRP